MFSESRVDKAAPGEAFSPSMKLSKFNVHFDAYMYANISVLISLEHFEVADGIKIFEEGFKNLKVMTRDSLVTCQISTTKVAEYLMSLPAHRENKDIKIIGGLTAVLSQAIDHSELLGAIIYYWNYHCYYLLDCIANEFNLEEVQMKLEVYKENLQCFKEQTLLVAFCQMEKKRPRPPYFSEIVAEFQWPNDVTLERVDEFRKDFLRYFQLHDYCMILAFMQLIESSALFRISWFIPDSVIDVVKVDLPEELFERYWITNVEVTENVVLPHSKFKQQVCA